MASIRLIWTSIRSKPSRRKPDRLPRKYSLENTPSKILLELYGNAGVESRRKIGSSRLSDSAKGQTTPVPREINSAGQSVMVFVIASKISPHPEVLTPAKLVIRSRPDSDSMDLRPIGASDGLTSLCGSSRREFC